MSLTSTQEFVLQKLASKILAIQKQSPIIVGINGIDGSGKSHLAKELYDYFKDNTNRDIICTSIDNFHSPRSIRYTKGRHSPLGFFEDSYQYDKLVSLFLEPLATGRSLGYIPRVFDLQSDKAVPLEVQTAQNNSIVIVEGIFLFRQELVDYFDLKVFVDISFDISFGRMLKRDISLFSSATELEKIFYERYKGGQEIYLAKCNPKEKSDVVIDNSDYETPRILDSN